MADAKPDLSRSGTMQVTAKEGIEYLEASGKDKLLEMQGLKDPAPEKPSVQRDNTMAVTAKEGIAFLQSSNEQKLLEMQGLNRPSPPDSGCGPSSAAENTPASDGGGSRPAVQRDSTMAVTAKEGIAYLEASNEQKLLQMQGLTSPNPSDKAAGSVPSSTVEQDSTADDAVKPSIQRDNTMAVTAKEGERLLGKDKPDADAKTRGQQQQIDSLKDEQPPAKKPRMAKGVTMVGTAKEAAAILGNEKPDADAMTRGQQKQIAALTKEPPASPAKKAKLPKHTTMVGTAKEAKGILGNEKLGDTRAETKQSKASRPSGPKRTSTIAKTMQEATYVVPEINVEEGRKTRSQSRGGDAKPAMKRAGTMQKTAKEGKDYLKRSKKSKKVETVEEEEEEEEEVTE